MTIRTLIDIDHAGKNYRLVHVPGGRVALDDRSRESHKGPCCQLQLGGRHVWCPADRQACLDAAAASLAPEAVLDAIRTHPDLPGSLAPAPKLEVLPGGAGDGAPESGADDGLDALPVKELRARAKELGLHAGGSAEELAARIRAHVTASAQAGAGDGAPEGGA